MDKAQGDGCPKPEKVVEKAESTKYSGCLPPLLSALNRLRKTQSKKRRAKFDRNFRNVEKAKPKASKWAKIKAIFRKNKVEPSELDEPKAKIYPRKEIEFPNCWPFTGLDEWSWDEEHISAFYAYVDSLEPHFALMLVNKWCMYWSAKVKEEEWAERKKEIVAHRERKKEQLALVNAEDEELLHNLEPTNLPNDLDKGSKVNVFKNENASQDDWGDNVPIANCWEVVSNSSNGDVCSQCSNSDNVSDTVWWTDVEIFDDSRPCYSSMSRGGVLVDYKAWETISLDGDCDCDCNIGSWDSISEIDYANGDIAAEEDSWSVVLDF